MASTRSCRGRFRFNLRAYATLHRADPQGSRQQLRPVVSRRAGRHCGRRLDRRGDGLAAEALEFAAEDWEGRDGSKRFPAPRTIDELRADAEFQEDAVDAVIAAVPFRAKAEAAA